jgi:23S rRNA pseudouridine1911/1915/1917 synthase
VKTTRSFVVAARETGRPLAAVLRGRLRVSWSAARRLVRDRRIRLGGQPCVDPNRIVTAGQRVQVLEARGPRGRTRARPPQTGQDPFGLRPTLRFVDAHVVVVDKPAGLTTMRHPQEAAEFGARARRFLPPTLTDRLAGLLPPLGSGRRPRLRAVHRLDKETSGLVVLARTAEAEQHLGRQFRAHTIERRYLAVVRGRAQPGRIESFLVRDRGDGRRGSTTQPGVGKRTVTHVRVLERLGAYSVVECRLETGRTHQVRIHLGEAGTPLCGEKVYDRPLHGQPVPDGSGSPRVALHAAVLGFDHPVTHKRMRWNSPLPADLGALVARLRTQAEE